MKVCLQVDGSLGKLAKFVLACTTSSLMAGNILDLHIEYIDVTSSLLLVLSQYPASLTSLSI